MPSPGQKNCRQMLLYYEGFPDEGFQVDQMVYGFFLFPESCVHIGY